MQSAEEWNNAIGGGCGLRPLGIGKKGKERLAAWKRCHEQKKAEGDTTGQNIWRGFKKVTLAPIRAGVLAAARINLFGFSRRLFPGFATDAQIKSERIKASSAAKARPAWAEVTTKWKKLGGKPDKLRQEITKGHRVRIQIFKRKSNFAGEFYSNVAGVDDAVIIAGLGTITAFLTAMNKSGTDKDPYEPGADPTGEGSNYEDMPSESDVAASENATGVSMRTGDPTDTSGAPVVDSGEVPTYVWVVVGIAGVAVVGVIGYMIYKSVKK